MQKLTARPILNDKGAGNFENGDEILLIASDSTTHDSKKYAIGEKAYFEDFKLPKGTSNANFSAMYPYPTEQIYSLTDYSTNRSYTDPNFDLLLASPVNVSTTETSHKKLVFRHAMHKLVINYTSDDTYSEEELVEIITTMNPVEVVAHIDLTKGEVTHASGNEPMEAKGKTISFVLPPQSIEHDMDYDYDYYGDKYKSLFIRIGDKSHRFSFGGRKIDGKDLTHFEGGKILTINIEVKRDEVRLNSFTISEWGNQGTINESINM
ncbi:MAG: fimbrillin family protein [Capnocytophaga sp.]|nr:fimbrillin family protein [Capnocytophaga sp.]